MIRFIKIDSDHEDLRTWDLYYRVRPNEIYQGLKVTSVLIYPFKQFNSNSLEKDSQRSIYSWPYTWQPSGSKGELSPYRLSFSLKSVASGSQGRDYSMYVNISVIFQKRSSWSLYQMVPQNMLHMHEGKQVFYEKNIPICECLRSNQTP